MSSISGVHAPIEAGFGRVLACVCAQYEQCQSRTVNLKWRETRSLSVASRHVGVRTLRRTASAPRGCTAAAAAAARTARQPRGTLYGVHFGGPSWSTKEDCAEPGKETEAM